MNMPVYHMYDREMNALGVWAPTGVHRLNGHRGLGQLESQGLRPLQGT